MEGEGERVKEGKRERGEEEGSWRKGRKDGKRKTNRPRCWTEPSVRWSSRATEAKTRQDGDSGGQQDEQRRVLKSSMKAANPGVKEKHLFLLLPR